MPLALMLGLIHVVIMVLGKLTDNDSEKYHAYDGFVGYAIIILRMGMYIYFLFGLKKTT